MTRLKPHARRAQILRAALTLAVDTHYLKVRWDNIARAADCSPSLVQYYYKTLIQLRRAVMREAVKTKCLPVIAQGLSAGCVYALRASESVRAAALDSLR